MTTAKIFAETMGQVGDNFDMGCDKDVGRGMHFIVNDWVLSAQAGWGSYCSADPNRSNCRLTKDTIRYDCEIAMWKVLDNKMIKLDGDTIMGWVSWDMVFDIINWLRKQKEIPTERKVRNEVIKLKNIYDIKEVI